MGAIGAMVLFVSVIGGCMACDTMSMNDCLLQLRSAMSPEAFLPDNMMKQCKQKADITECLNRYNSGCSSTQMKTFNMATDFLDFFCTSSFLKGLKHAKDICLGDGEKDNYEKMLSQCEVMKIGAGCEKAQKVVKCTNRYLTKVCDVKTASLYGSLFTYTVHMSNKYLKQPLCVLESVGGDKSEGLPTKYVIPIVLGCLTLVGAVIGVVIFVLRQQHRRSRDAFINHDVLARI